MTFNQEDAIYNFLEDRSTPFILEDVVTYIRKHLKKFQPTQKVNCSTSEIVSFIDSKHLAFHLDDKKWITRRGCFENIPFVINPTRLEIINGILIPGHRCIPFANPILFPHEYYFMWKNDIIPHINIEGEPEEFYPFYNMYGEEYAPQYLAKDNPDNEEAYKNEQYDDPPEIYISTLDMRNIYRETGFIPGDRFIAKSINWKQGAFSLERVSKNKWTDEELNEWLSAAEQGFQCSFEFLGPANSIEDQIAYAYWYGGERMRSVPAHSLEDFLYKITDRIEITSYGVETRFWYAGKEIPDKRELEKNYISPDRTSIENILYENEIPLSEYAVNAYVRDAFFQNDADILNIIKRIVPSIVKLDERDWKILFDYVTKTFSEMKDSYVYFKDQKTGPLRQRVGELHTAVIELIVRLKKGDIEASWLPKHTFILLSQIQSHTASILEDLEGDDNSLSKAEFETLDNSIDTLIETYEDVKEMLDESLNNFRLSNFSLVKSNKSVENGRVIQVSIGGTDVWRRVVVPESCTLEALHWIIQTLFSWKAKSGFRFISESVIKKSNKNSNISHFNAYKTFDKELDIQIEVADLTFQGIMELTYEYGTKWVVKLLFLARYDLEYNEEVRCIAGAGAAPPESIEGPVRFKKCLALLANGSLQERHLVLQELGNDFDAEAFNMFACNRELKNLFDD